MKDLFYKLILKLPRVKELYGAAQKTQKRLSEDYNGQHCQELGDIRVAIWKIEGSLK